MKNYLLLITLLVSFWTHAQENLTVTIYCKNMSGSPYPGVEVKVTDRVSGETLTGTTNGEGGAEFSLKPATDYKIVLSNSEIEKQLVTPNVPGVNMNKNFRYTAGEEDWGKKYPLSDAQIKSLNKQLAAMGDTVDLIEFRRKYNDELFAEFKLDLIGLDGKGLPNEIVYFDAQGRSKVFVGKTSSTGKLKAYLPKGDDYRINFYYDKHVDRIKLEASQGFIENTMRLQYEGTKNIEKRRAEEAKRLAEEAKRLEKERKEFEKYCKKMRMSALEARKAEIEEYKSGERSFADKVILKVFERNKHWKNKLVVTDVTGSMNPYTAQLSTWFGMNYMHEQDARFVFFNDGNDMDDYKKDELIGNIGGIYYSKGQTLDTLVNDLVRAAEAGSGGDVDENNMEALIKAVKYDNDFKELIMIADNHAPIKDIALLPDFKTPVRIILCGVRDDIHPDYLKLAYETKGSVHTIEEDILDLHKHVNGDTIELNGVHYKYLNGRFIKLTDL